MSRWVLPRWVLAVVVIACVVTTATTALAPPTLPATQIAPPALSATPQVQPSPATTRSTDPGAILFPDDCNVLLARSIFLRGARPGAAPTTAPGQRPISPEAGFVLRGVASQGPMRTALLEDQNTHSTRQLHVGDDVIGGKVVAITTDGVDRTLGGRMVHITVGQPIDGSAPPPPPPPPGVAIAAGPQPTTQPGLTPDGSPTVISDPVPSGTPVQATLKIIETK